MRKIALLLVATICCLTLVGCSNSKYEKACQAVYDGDIELAKQLFEELPQNYEPSNYRATPEQWLLTIDKYYNSAYIGTWKNGSYSIEISMNSDSVSGVYLSYYKRYTSPGGVSVTDRGRVSVSKDGKTATYYSSSASNAKNYELKLIDENTIEVWFDGIKGNNLEITLSRVGST